MRKHTDLFCFALAAVLLAVGASFHSWRTDAENLFHFRVGVCAGIVCAVLALVFVLAGIILILKRRKGK